MKIKLSLLFACILCGICAAEEVIKFDDRLKDGDGIAAMAEIVKEISQKRGAPVRVEFSPKLYVFPKNKEHSWFMNLSGLKNVTIDGRGATIKFPAYNAFCKVNFSENITVKNFNFEHSTLPFTQGEILGKNEKESYFLLKLDDGYPELPSNEFVMKNYPGPQWMWGSFMDRKTRALKRGIMDHFFIGKVEETETPRQYKIYAQKGYEWVLRDIRENTAFAMPVHQEPCKDWPNRNGVSTIGVTNSKDILFENITMRAIRILGMAGTGNVGKVTFKNCILTWRENSNDLISSWRDGSHFKNNKIGPTLDGCMWEGLLDDCINISTSPSFVKEELGGSKYRLHGGSYEKGAKLGVLYPDKGKWILDDDLYITDCAPGGVVTLSKPLSDVVNFQEITQYEAVSGRGHKNARATQLYNMGKVNDGFAVRNCKFGIQRRFSMIIRAPNGIIENNEIRGGTGVWLSNELGSWYEGPLPFNITMRNNKFAGTLGDRPLSIGVQTASPEIPLSAKLNINIENNEFILTPENKQAIAISSGQGIKINGNRFLDSNGKKIPSNEAVKVGNNAEVSISD